MNEEVDSVTEINSSSSGSDSSGSSFFFGFNIKSHHVLIFSIIVLLVLAYIFRNYIAIFHDRWRMYRRHTYSNLGESFQHDLENGLNSDNFDISSNIDSDDRRKGLEESSKSEILKIMSQNRRLTFDEARLIYTQRQMISNGIGPDGRPLDPRAVVFK